MQNFTFGKDEAKLKEITLTLDHSSFYLKNKSLIITLEDAYKQQKNLIEVRYNGYTPSEVLVMGKKKTVNFRLYNTGRHSPPEVEEKFPIVKNVGFWGYEPSLIQGGIPDSASGYKVFIVNAPGDLKPYDR